MLLRFCGRVRFFRRMKLRNEPKIIPVHQFQNLEVRTAASKGRNNCFFYLFYLFYLYFRQGSIFGHKSTRAFPRFWRKKEQFSLFLVRHLHRSYKKNKNLNFNQEFVYLYGRETRIFTLLSRVNYESAHHDLFAS